MTASFPFESVATAADLKRVNRQKILQTLRSGNAMTVSDIHDKTGISRITVMRALQDYCNRGIVKSQGLGNTTSLGGKRPEMFVFGDARKLLCINLWPQSTTLALSTLVSDVYAVKQLPRGYNGSLEHAIDLLHEDVKSYLSEEQVSIQDLYGVALSVPGTSVSWPEWTRLPHIGWTCSTTAPGCTGGPSKTAYPLWRVAWRKLCARCLALRRSCRWLGGPTPACMPAGRS